MTITYKSIALSVLSALSSFGIATPSNPDVYPIPVQTYTQSLPFRGTNLSGAEFNGSSPESDLPNIPTVVDTDYFVYKGINIVRVPFALEYLVPPNNLQGDSATVDFNSDYGKAFSDLINNLTLNQPLGKRLMVILDMHNYMHYNPGNLSADYDSGNPNIIGSTTCNGRNCPTTAQYASIWAQIAKHFANNPNVMFELMNEPQGLSPEKTLALENAAIAKIRSAETVPHTIVLDGAFWSGLHSWVDDTEHPGYSTNAAVFTESNIKDPANQYILDVHQYFDPDSSGRYTSACTDAATLEANMHFGDFKTWAEAHHMRVILGEFGAHYDFTDPSDPTHHLNDVENCRADFSTVLNDVASFASPEPLKAGSAGFVGWTVWSAGHAWGDYLMNISPDGPANSWMSDPQVFANPALLNPVADLPPFGEKIAEICNHTTENIPFSSNFGPFESTEGGGLNAMSNGEMSCDSIDSPKASGEESPSYAGGSGSHADHYAELTYGSYLDGQYAGIGLTNEGSAYSWGSLENGTLQIQPEPDNACPTLGATDLPNRCYWFVKN